MSAIIERHLATLLSRSWWVLLVRGLIAIGIGIVAWFRPGLSLAALVLLFGAYMLADGILGVWTAITGRKDHEDWGLVLLWGLIGVGVGLLTLVAPALTAIALLFYVAAWAIATGVLEIVAAIRLRKEMRGEWLLILGGLASVALGVLLMARPGAGVITLVWLIGSYAVIFGLLLVILSFNVRSFGRSLAAGSPA
jgi:uncharacterized membrane protein HdeD (DUF308 family)